MPPTAPSPTSVRLHIKTDPVLKDQAQALAREAGVSLSDVVRLALNEFLRTHATADDAG